MLELIDYVVEYPNEKLLDGIPQNTCYAYVSSNYLNGICNYLKTFAVFGIERYRDWLIHKDKMLVNMAVNNERLKGYHTDYSVFPDDVIVLAETDDSFWELWYDKDVSDCSILRISKDKVYTREEFESMRIRELECTFQENKDKVRHPDHELITGRFVRLPLPQGWWKG